MRKVFDVYIITTERGGRFAFAAVTMNSKDASVDLHTTDNTFMVSDTLDSAHTLHESYLLALYRAVKAVCERIPEKSTIRVHYRGDLSFDATSLFEERISQYLKHTLAAHSVTMVFYEDVVDPFDAVESGFPTLKHDAMLDITEKVAARCIAEHF